MFSNGALSNQALSEVGDDNHLMGGASNFLDGLPTSFNKAADKRKKQMSDFIGGFDKNTLVKSNSGEAQLNGLENDEESINVGQINMQVRQGKKANQKSVNQRKEELFSNFLVDLYSFDLTEKGAKSGGFFKNSVDGNLHKILNPNNLSLLDSKFEHPEKKERNLLESILHRSVVSHNHNKLFNNTIS